MEPYFRIDELWGLSLPFGALESETSGRKLLWQRAKKMTLQEVEKALGYSIKIVDGSEKPEKEKRPFRKSDLQPGMVVLTKNGDKWVVLPCEEGLFLLGDYVKSSLLDPEPYRVATPLKFYRDDLTGDGRLDSGLTIVKVWGRIEKLENVDDAFTTNTEHRRTIWQKDKRRPMTREEIEKALGYPVVIVTNANK